MESLYCSATKLPSTPGPTMARSTIWKVQLQTSKYPSTIDKYRSNQTRAKSCKFQQGCELVDQIVDYDRTRVRQKINHKSGTVVFDISHSRCTPLILVTWSLGWICKDCVTEAVIAPSTLLPKELRPTNIMHETRSLQN